MKMPNGYGSIVKLSGKRRRPYRVRLGCEYSSDGATLTESRRTLGYYATKKEAIEALNAYHLDPYDIDDNSTFAEIYEKWIKEKSLKVGKTTLNSYRAAYKKCIAVHTMPMRNIKLTHLQAVMDSYPAASLSTLHNIEIVISGVFAYAMKSEIIRKDPSQYLTINAYAEPTEKHKVFTAAEIRALWEMPQTLERDITLILLYSGWRVNELLEMPKDNVDMTAQTMTGGKKTKAGKDRVVPIHHLIKPLLSRYPMPFDIPYPAFREWMKTNLRHIPHDTRHTFISELQSRGADHICIERLVGHASKGITDTVYTHKDIQELRRTVEMIAYKDIQMNAVI
ncbi:MAG: tyrosine-type recombinase/integrase [Oscillospiraceae bacterium]|nr:tyrosine-type recombinase/integrase [Oscillospiraceae bacterium]